MNRLIIFLLFLATHISVFSQIDKSYFELPDANIQYSVSFKLINNLIIIPVKVNGDELNFILDSGVSNNIIFNLTTDDSVLLYDLKMVKLRGLGSDGPVDAYFSNGNVFSIGDLIGYNQEMYILSNEIYDLSTKLGINVHGVIGYELFKNFMIKINYKKKILTFYQPEKIDVTRKFKKFQSLPITLEKKKPYLDASVRINENNQRMPVHLLIDSGGGDSLWLFSDGDKGIDIPDNNYYQYMGMGLSGKIYGSMSKLDELEIQSFIFNNPNVSFPDSLSIGNAKTYSKRDGSIGGGILKRFHVVFDYPNERILLKKNGNFRDPFNYNISGMEVVYDGKVVVKVISNDLGLMYSGAASSETIRFETLFDYEFRPVYKIFNVSPNTPAFQAGIQKNDFLIKIGNKFTTDLTLEEINGYLQKPQNKLKITLLRDGREINTSMELIDIF